jgi:hypothetical protein
VDARERFDWPANRAWIRLERVQAASGGLFRAEASASAYAPLAARIQVSLNGGEWKEAGKRLVFDLPPGEHELSARLISPRGWNGRPETLWVRIPPTRGSGT